MYDITSTQIVTKKITRVCEKGSLNIGFARAFTAWANGIRVHVSCALSKSQQSSEVRFRAYVGLLRSWPED